MQQLVKVFRADVLARMESKRQDDVYVTRALIAYIPIHDYSDQAKEKYETECIRTKGLSAQKMNLVGKELDKVSMKIEKTELSSRAAGTTTCAWLCCLLYGCLDSN